VFADARACRMGASPLVIALSNGHVSCVEVLKRAEADLSLWHPSNTQKRGTIRRIIMAILFMLWVLLEKKVPWTAWSIIMPTFIALSFWKLTTNST
jgi:hypothetical protein